MFHIIYDRKHANQFPRPPDRTHVNCQVNHFVCVTTQFRAKQLINKGNENGYYTVDCPFVTVATATREQRTFDRRLSVAQYIAVGASSLVDISGDLAECMQDFLKIFPGFSCCPA